MCRPLRPVASLTQNWFISIIKGGPLPSFTTTVPFPVFSPPPAIPAVVVGITSLIWSLGKKPLRNFCHLSVPFGHQPKTSTSLDVNARLWNHRQVPNQGQFSYKGDEAAALPGQDHSSTSTSLLAHMDLCFVPSLPFPSCLGVCWCPPFCD